VREDEVDQEPITVVPKLTPLSVVLTLDTSGSMKKTSCRSTGGGGDWLPRYPESKAEGVSVIIDPETAKRVGSYFFRTSDEIKQVHDFYEDGMTRVTWDVSRAPTQVWGSSEAERRKFEVTRSGAAMRSGRVSFLEKNRKNGRLRGPEKSGQTGSRPESIRSFVLGSVCSWERRNSAPCPKGGVYGIKKRGHNRDTYDSYDQLPDDDNVSTVYHLLSPSMKLEDVC
jgi:hypothetical protein